MSAADTLYSQALALTPVEREQLAVRILTSLELPDVEADRAWLAELGRRSDELERGVTSDMDAWDALAQLRTKHAERPGP
jgi:putative addiction module component (TIGR02574 family)